MALPIKTTVDDVRGVIRYFGTKPTGATITDAKAAISATLLDGRKLSAYRRWEILTKDGDRYKLTPLGWELHRKPVEEQPALLMQIIDGIKPYRAAIEWMFHQGFDEVSVIDVAANWHEHHLGEIGADAKDATIRENAVAFFHLCQAAGLGRLVVGRGGNPTRFAIDKQALRAHIEAGPSAPPWTATTSTSEPQFEEPSSAEPPAEEDTVVELVQTPHTAELRAFISHGKNMSIVEQVETLLGLADIPTEVAEAEETTAIPVPDKVFDAMRRCTVGIIVCSVEESNKDGSGKYALNDNVLIEIGAAFVLYERQVVLVWDKRLPIPSNLQGLYRCEYEGDALDWDAGMKLMRAIQRFKKPGVDAA